VTIKITTYKVINIQVHYFSIVKIPYNKILGTEISGLCYMVILNTTCINISCQ
jgi:hypothetical protein